MLSNSSMNYCPNNTLTHYTTKLPEITDLVGAWKIGLAEIQYTHSWHSVMNNEAWLKVQSHKTIHCPCHSVSFARLTLQVGVVCFCRSCLRIQLLKDSGYPSHLGRSIDRQDGEDFKICVSSHFQIWAAVVKCIETRPPVCLVKDDHGEILEGTFYVGPV
jgi:hypothetical protein